ncbi:ABC transporter substrate-binding protein [Pseudomonas sp. BF-R-26]|uniref:ABC transporter substrate-binding protein n=1 Tax=Pseudomonas sp. BF-R-26 TaxID=2832398 RepID=UPI001CBFDAC4|nr:ABC transporter substrate-binding protein [Pseudomonas sp. BF-R-26]
MKKMLICAVTSLACVSAMAQENLTIVTYGGSLAAAQTKAAIKPFSEKTGVKTTLEDYSGGIAQLKAQVDTKNVTWDVVDMELPDAVRACNAGLFERINPSKDLEAGTGGAPVDVDFISGAVTDCAVANIIWSTAVAYNVNAFKGEQPATLKDFFDLNKFPGKRGLRKAPQGTLEWALLADGVPRNEVYSTLETEAGIERAFAKLDSIKSQVIWWEAGAQPPQLLADGQVVMTSAWNGRIWTAQTQEKQPFKIIWDGQLYDMDVWAVPAGSKNKARAMEFLKFATSTPVLAEQSKYIAYGPTRKSSQALVSEEMKPHLPTSSENFKTALQMNAEWWGDHADELNERFNAWLTK